jgi:topoisomerase IA-like protein
MSIEKLVLPYSLFIRFDEEGHFQGAHATDIVSFVDTDTGEASVPKETEPRPVTLEEFGALLGERNATLVEDAASARAEAAALRAELDATAATLDRETALRQQAEARLAAAAAALSA